MAGKIMKRLRNFIYFTYSSLMIFYELLPNFLITLINIAFILYVFLSLRSNYSLLNSIVIISLMLIPTSTIPILGESSKLLLSWFHITIITAMIIILLSGKVRRKYFVPFFIFGTMEILQLLFSIDFFDGFKQLFMIMLFLSGLVIGEELKRNNSKELCCELIQIYMIGIYSFALQIILQKLYIFKTGHVIGLYSAMGGGRIAYGGLMGDFSFATLYLATGCLIILLRFLNSERMSYFKFFSIEVFLLIPMLIISARTGLVAFVIILMIYYMTKIKKMKLRDLIFIIITIILIPYLFKIIMSSRGQTLLDSSGRLDNFRRAIKIWNNRIIFGYGLGRNNLFLTTGLVVPHNFFIQYILQIGLFGVILILLPVISLIRNDIMYSGYFKWVFWLVVVGAMFIPDIVSSRFLYGVVVICMIIGDLYKKEIEI